MARGRVARGRVALAWALAAATLAFTGAGLAATDAEQPERPTEPLEVPGGPLPAPDDSVGLPTRERVERAAAMLQRRGFSELPVLSLALLAMPGADPAVLERARELAPNHPGVRFEIARQAQSPRELVAALVAVARSFPGVLWLLTFGGAVLGGAILAAAALAATVAFLRTAGLHGHALGHLGAPSEPPTWPGVLLLCSGLALLPLAGAGPLLVLGVGGMLALWRLRVQEAAPLALLLACAGLVAGPGLDRWAAAAALPGHAPALLAAWRAERGQPLPGDLARLERAVQRQPDAALFRLGLAAAWKREGRLADAAAALASFPANAPPPLVARAVNLRGILSLARGDVASAKAAFERALSIEESAAVVYNLSQAHGRSLQLAEQTTLFARARELDPELVSRYTRAGSINLHRYLIENPAPLWTYLRAAVEPSAPSRELSGELRRVLLGPRESAWSWLLLPVLAGLGLALRRVSVRRCATCLRGICDACAPTAADGWTCIRCARLASEDSRADTRMRQRQLALDRRRRAALARTLAAIGLLAPGAPALLEGSAVRGCLSFVVLCLGPAALIAPRLVGAPAEVGRLATALPFAMAWAALVPLYLFGLREALQRLREGGGGP